MAGRVRRAASAAKAIVVRGASSAVRRVRRAPRRVGEAAVTVYRSPSVRRAARRAAVGVARGAGIMAVAQAKIAPALVGGYALGRIERGQRKATSDMLNAGDKPVSGPLIKDPMYRLVAYAGLSAIGASRTTGLIQAAFYGWAGGVGTLYEMYSATSDNPVDDYTAAVRKELAAPAVKK